MQLCSRTVNGADLHIQHCGVGISPPAPPVHAPSVAAREGRMLQKGRSRKEWEMVKEARKG